jgi:hypothetical protein
MAIFLLYLHFVEEVCDRTMVTYEWINKIFRPCCFRALKLSKLVAECEGNGITVFGLLTAWLAC